MISIHNLYRTKSGKSVRIIEINADMAWPVMGVIEGERDYSAWNMAGENDEDHENDLEEGATGSVFFLNWRKDWAVPRLYASKTDAARNVTADRPGREYHVVAQRIEIEAD